MKAIAKLTLAFSVVLLLAGCAGKSHTIYGFTAESNKGQEVNFAANPDIKWNFTKFLIDRKGRVVARFEPVVAPEDLDAEILALL